VEKRYSVITIGRAGVDMYPLESGKVLAKVSRFGRFLGGSPANVAVAAARLGHSSALISRVGADDFGDFIMGELRRLGVGTEFVQHVEHAQTPITFCELFPPDHFPLYFYAPNAPYFEIHRSELNVNAIADADVFWMTLTGLAAEPSRSAHNYAWEIRGRRRHTVLDLDYRERFWASSDEARRTAHDALRHASIAIGNRAECALVSGWSEPRAAAEWLLEQGVSIAFVKRGPDGVLAMTADECVELPAIPIEVVNGLGAGDAFGGAVCHGLIEKWSLERIAHFANAAGACVAQVLPCAEAMPTSADVEALLLRELPT
jgi:5-dehydro-2-deoxygluconokinase